MPCDSIAQTVLSDDAYVSFSSSNGNFGTNPTLTVSGANSAYIKFRVAAVLPAATPGTKIAKATIKLYVGKVARPGKVDVYFAANGWTETTIAANNAPSVGAAVLTTEQLSKNNGAAIHRSGPDGGCSAGVAWD